MKPEALPTPADLLWLDDALNGARVWRGHEREATVLPGDIREKLAALLVEVTELRFSMAQWPSEDEQRRERAEAWEAGQINGERKDR